MPDEWIKISGVRTATPNTVYTQQGAKLACQEDINAKFSHLLFAQLPQTQFTHSKAPNPHVSKTSAQKFRLLLAQLPQTQFTHSKGPNSHARKTSTQNFRISYWHSYPEHTLHTARRQTRMSARHQRKIFASPIGTATPNTLYTQQGAKTAWQDDINAKFSHPFGTATPNTVYTQQGAKLARQEDISTKFSHLLFAQLPRTQFTHSKAHLLWAQLPRTQFTQGKTSAQNFRISYWHSYPEHTLHTARRQTRMPGRHQRKIFASPIGTATPNTVYTQQGAKLACQEDIDAKLSHLLLAQLPRTHFTHSKLPKQHGRTTSTQNFRISYWHSYPEHRLHAARRQTRMPGRHQRKIFASPIGTAAPNTVYTQQAAPAQQRHRAPQPLLEALDTAPASETEKGTPRAAMKRRHPAPQPHATPSKGSGYCVCHADRR